MERKPLKDYFDKIVEHCGKDVEVGCRDYDGDDYRTNYICFEEDGYYIEGSFGVCADIIEDGDGYWTPYVTSVRRASVRVDELEVSWCDPVTDEEEDVPQEEIDALRDYIENEIPEMVED